MSKLQLVRILIERIFWLISWKHYLNTLSLSSYYMYNNNCQYKVIYQRCTIVHHLWLEGVVLLCWIFKKLSRSMKHWSQWKYLPMNHDFFQFSLFYLQWWYKVMMILFVPYAPYPRHFRSLQQQQTKTSV